MAAGNSNSTWIGIVCAKLRHGELALLHCAGEVRRKLDCSLSKNCFRADWKCEK